MLDTSTSPPRIVEVKSSTSVREHFLGDCAIQAWTLRQLGLGPSTTAVAIIDRDFVYNGDGYSGLFREVDVADDIEALIDRMPETIAATRDTLESLDEPEREIGLHCTSPHVCPFFEHCAPEQGEFPVTDLGGKREPLYALINSGKCDIRELSEEQVSGTVQTRIWRQTVAGEPLLDVGDLSKLEVTAEILTSEAVRIQAGDRVAVLSRNRFEYLETVLACGWIGAIAALQDFGSWLENDLLPRSTGERMRREATGSGQGGRTMEIQRLIGRSLRAAVDLNKLGPRTITLDCDVIQADGGTRTAAISGAYVALDLAMRRMGKAIPKNPLHGRVAAVSVGIYGGAPVLDLDYAEDSEAETDMNIVMNDAGHFIEVQGTAEGHAFTDDELAAMLGLARAGIADILAAQNEAIAAALS